MISAYSTQGDGRQIDPAPFLPDRTEVWLIYTRGDQRDRTIIITYLRKTLISGTRLPGLH